MDLEQWFCEYQSRRSVLRQFGMLAGISLAFDACASNNPPPIQPSMGHNSIEHVLVACQENRTFDEYFGYYPRAGKFGIPASYAQPDGKGGTVTPQHNFLPISNNPSHSWQSIHSEWNHGKMDGFYTAAGSTALGYYNGS